MNSEIKVVLEVGRGTSKTSTTLISKTSNGGTSKEVMVGTKAMVGTKDMVDTNNKAMGDTTSRDSEVTRVTEGTSGVMEGTGAEVVPATMEGMVAIRYAFLSFKNIDFQCVTWQIFVPFLQYNFTLSSQSFMYRIVERRKMTTFP